jgi:hypothetical protein
MKTISYILFFLNHHPFWSFLIIGALFLLFASLTKKWIFSLFALLLPVANIFCAHMLNAWFLNKYGEKSTAVVTHGEQTNSTLNDAYIWNYDAVVKTLDGKDILTGFSTSSASIYPIRNRIIIPPVGQRFVIKFIPGYEKNFVILSDESVYGKMRIISEKRELVEKAKRTFEASPGNAEFRQAYREAMLQFVNDGENALDSSAVEMYKAILSGMQ